MCRVTEQNNSVEVGFGFEMDVDDLVLEFFDVKMLDVYASIAVDASVDWIPKGKENTKETNRTDNE